MNKNLDYRQGDVGLRKVDKPEGLKVKRPVAGRVVLALGETTGHMHAMDGAVMEVEHNGQRLVWVVAETPLKHIDATGNATREHDWQAVSTGWYVVERQVQLTDDDEVRQVLD